jgi:hypothetical protein
MQVKEARLEGDGVSGVFGDEHLRLTKPIILCEAFLNCRSNEDVLRFTKRYGPLFLQYENVVPTGLPFSFPLQEWLEFQYDLKTLWGGSASVDSLAFRVGVDENCRPLDEQFVFSRKRGGHEFVFGDLSRMIKFLVHVLPDYDQRRCARPDCGTYFFSSDRKRIYCGASACKHWAALRAKNEWWKRNGENYLALRQTKR